MSYTNYSPSSVYAAPVESRISFIRKTYLHLTGAVALFTLVSAMMYTAGVGEKILSFMTQGTFAWIILLIVFIGASSVAQGMARAGGSSGLAYLGLGLFAVVEALIFAPMFFIAAHYFPGVLPNATIITLTTFVGLTGYVLIYNKDFSFLGAGLAIALMVALGILVVGMLFGFNLGVWYSGLVIAIACGYILYDTSNVMRNFGPNQYVFAALQLFSSLALLFMYVIRILMQLQRR
jgi:FtsH-binding integral membrane protein